MLIKAAPTYLQNVNLLNLIVKVIPYQTCGADDEVQLAFSQIQPSRDAGQGIVNALASHQSTFQFGTSKNGEAMRGYG